VKGSPVNGRAVDQALASGRSPNPLLGRDDELARIDALLASAAGGAGSLLLVEGPPGVGKTALLGAAADRAAGVRCLWMHGVESETVLGHAGLLELLTPLRHRLPDIPRGQAAALTSALGWEDPGAVPDRFLVAAATLSLVGVTAATEPVLVLVDDVQWVDAESIAALLFAAARLGRDPVSFLVAARDDASLPAALRSAPVLRLSGLAGASAAALVAGAVSDGVVDRLVEATGGVPLALLDVLPQLTTAQRVGAVPLPEPLPVGARLVDGYVAALEALSGSAWRAALLAAVATPGDGGRLRAALAEETVDPTVALDEAETLGILVRDGVELRFRHPLLRTAVLRKSSPAERRAAHRALAGNQEGLERTWHLALAAGGVDEALAGELARAAASSRGRWGSATASEALERAAVLTADHLRAGGWLAAATEEAVLAGDAERARRLSRRVLAGAAPPSARSRVLFSTGVLEQYAGSVPRAAGLLDEAAADAEGAALVQVLAELVLTYFRLGDVAQLVDRAGRLDRVADRDDPGQRVLADFTGGLARLLTGDAAGGLALMGDVVTGTSLATLRSDPRHIMLVALASGFLGDPRKTLALGGRLVDELRERGSLGILVPLLALRAGGRSMVGDHAGAFADAGEAAELGEQLGYAADTAVAVEMLAWQSAARGQHDDARRALDRARQLTDVAGTTSVAAHQALTAAFCALCRGDLALTVAVLEARIAADGGVGEMGEPLGVAPLLVEAYAGLGRRAEAAALTRLYREVSSGADGPLRDALVARCAGLSATDDDDAVTAFQAALASHARSADPFEAARTRLLLGSRLRRSGSRVAARAELTAAADAFAAMELTAWYRRAADELAATGATARPRRPLATQPLTSQETRVALLVAQGCSNKEVAASLFLSPKTVEHHLGSVFRKRGFRSRTELAAAFAAAPPA
jgi:DNA-binding CsgD family transcriptional regulator/tetratricopeptide (TPR) repeat protein